MSKQRTYTGRAIAVRYDVKRCIHAAECVRTLPAVFDPGRRPWIDPDAAGADDAAAEAVAAAVERCPTGALTYQREDGSAERPDARCTIALDPGGPIWVRGDVTLLDGDGATIAREARVALCRCGASTIKPYCDGSHEAAGFRDPGAIPDPRLRAQDGAAEDGPVEIKVSSGGPLIVDGPVTLRDATGTTVARGTRGALCRCGASANKPFCDGSHTKLEDFG